MSVMDFLGKEYRSSYGLPVINIPGCIVVATSRQFIALFRHKLAAGDYVAAQSHRAK